MFRTNGWCLMGTHVGRGGRRGFTLIEILVVVAIIGLLMAILMPTLARVREQGRITICQANCREIGKITAEYQTANLDHVPVMFNYHSATHPDSQSPARVSYMSVAFRSYSASTRRLQSIDNGFFNPEAHWDTDKILPEYNRRLLPEHYVCPFVRGSAAEPVAGFVDLNRSVSIEGGGERVLFEFRGKMDSYHTWLRENVVMGRRYSGFNPASEDGVVKDTAMTWNRVKADGEFPNGDRIRPIPGSIWITEDDVQRSRLSNMHRRWDAGDARRLRCSLSHAVVAYCARGEHLGDRGKWYNRGSHRRTSGGGTNVIYTDGHVGFTKGTQIGP